MSGAADVVVMIVLKEIPVLKSSEERGLVPWRLLGAC